MPRSNDHPASIDSRQQADANTGSSHPLKVSVELDPAYELSVSRHRTRKPGSPMGSGRSVDIHWEQPGSPNEPSEPSGLEHLIDHSRNLNSVPRSREDLRQPPPVESATKIDPRYYFTLHRRQGKRLLITLLSIRLGNISTNQSYKNLK
jgi:hypothetical protein